jgi:ATP-binding cassette subfamily B protein
VRRPRVLILDEATSALDAITEQRVQQNLQRLRTTRIVAAHRLSTVRQADRILVLENGRVVDSGTHDELLERPGVYRQLVAAQLEGTYRNEEARMELTRGQAPPGLDADSLAGRRARSRTEA